MASENRIGTFGWHGIACRDSAASYVSGHVERVAVTSRGTRKHHGESIAGGGMATFADCVAGTVITVVAVTVLYWAQSIFIPVALAVFLTFLLNPLVTALRQRGLRRTPAVIFTVWHGGDRVWVSPAGS